MAQTASLSYMARASTLADIHQALLGGGSRPRCGGAVPAEPLEEGALGSSPGPGSPEQCQAITSIADYVRTEEEGLRQRALWQPQIRPRAKSLSGIPSSHGVTQASRPVVLLNQVRRQIEAFQDGSGSQISRTLDDSIGDSDAYKDVKIGLQLRLEGQLAVLGGNFRCLSDTVQAQVGRVDLMNKRFTEWSTQLKEEGAQKCKDLEQRIQQVLFDIRRMFASTEKAQSRLHHRLHRLEVDIGERLAMQAETAERFGTFGERLDALEQQWERGRAAAEASFCASNASRSAPTFELSENAVSRTVLGLLEQRLFEVAGKVDRLAQEGGEVHTSLGLHEEQQRALRTIVQTMEGQLRSLGERIERSNWDRRLDLLHTAIQEEADRRVDYLERVEVIAKRAEFQEQALEELRGSFWQSHRPAACTVAMLDAQQVDSATCYTESTVPKLLQECHDRLELYEDRLAALNVEVDDLRIETRHASRAHQLGFQLKEIVPEVTGQGKNVKYQRGHMENMVARNHTDKFTDSVCQLKRQLPVFGTERPARAHVHFPDVG